jgi:hypothetical protein
MAALIFAKTCTSKGSSTSSFILERKTTATNTITEKRMMSRLALLSFFERLAGIMISV